MISYVITFCCRELLHDSKNSDAMYVSFFYFSLWIKVAFKKSGGAKFMHIMQCKTEIRIEKKSVFIALFSFALLSYL